MVLKRTGFTLIELIISLAIISIVMMVGFSIYFFGVNTYAKGEKQIAVQYDTRTTADYITNRVRFAYSVEILVSTTSIPNTITNDDCYFYKDTFGSKDRLIFKDNTGTKVVAEFDALTPYFTTSGAKKTLYFNIQGRYENQNFSIDSKVLPLNLSVGETIIGTNGIAVKIVKEASTAGSAILFSPAPPHIFSGTSYNHVFTTSGGTFPYSFTLEAGSLPPGIALDSSGRLVGVPTTQGKYEFKIKVTDSSSPSSQYASRTFELIIGDPTLSAAIIAQRISDGTYPLIQPVQGETSLKLPEVPNDYLVVIYSSSDPSVVETDGTIVFSAMSKTVGITFQVISLINNNSANTSVLNVAVPSTTNSAPVAQNVVISGVSRVGNTLTGSYTYVDTDLEGASTYKWYRSSNQNGSGKTSIGTGTSLVLLSTESGKYVFFGVTPIAATGTILGTEVISTPVQVLPAGNKPKVTNVQIAKSVEGNPVSKVNAGDVLYGSYVYSDVDDTGLSKEFNTTFQWYFVDSNNVMQKIVGATSETYTTTSSDDNKTISFEVTPKSSEEPMLGDAVTSANVYIK